MLKIRIKADLRCPEGHRVREGNFRASCEPCLVMHQTIVGIVDTLKQAIADYERQYPGKEDLSNEQAI